MSNSKLLSPESMPLLSGGLIQKVISIKDSMVKSISSGKLNSLADHDNSNGRPKSQDENWSKNNTIGLLPRSAQSLQRDFPVLPTCPVEPRRPGGSGEPGLLSLKAFLSESAHGSSKRQSGRNKSPKR